MTAPSFALVQQKVWRLILIQPIKSYTKQLHPCFMISKADATQHPTLTFLLKSARIFQSNHELTSCCAP